MIEQHLHQIHEVKKKEKNEFKQSNLLETPSTPPIGLKERQAIPIGTMPSENNAKQIAAVVS